MSLLTVCYTFNVLKIRNNLPDNQQNYTALSGADDSETLAYAPDGEYDETYITDDEPGNISETEPLPRETETPQAETVEAGETETSQTEAANTEETEIPPAPEQPDADREKLPDKETEPIQAPEKNSNSKLPEGFVYLKEFLPEARFEVRYATTHNFTGQVVDGYLSDNICLTIEAAEALKKASEYLKKQGYGILIYDAYRPKRAVDFFMEWSKKPEDYSTKEEFYPNFTKEYLFENGYLARRSAHSRGSTVDLTLFYLDTGELVDMGSPYDFLDPISNHGTDKITEEQTRNRNILKEAMNKAGFKAISTEWWHYTLIDEPYPDTYFDFVIE